MIEIHFSNQGSNCQKHNPISQLNLCIGFMVLFKYIFFKFVFYLRFFSDPPSLYPTSKQKHLNSYITHDWALISVIFVLSLYWFVISSNLAVIMKIMNHNGVKSL